MLRFPYVEDLLIYLPSPRLPYVGELLMESAEG